MADLKITGLTAATTLADTDLLTAVIDPGGTPLNRKITIANVKTVLFASPTLVTPTLGVASATSINKVAITAPAIGATLTIADGKTLTVSNDATVSGTNTGDQTISDVTITTTDIVTNNVSTLKHGFAPKAPNDATKYLDGTGAYSVPAGSASPAGSDGDYQIKSGTALAAGVVAQGSTGRITITPTAASSGVAPYLRVITPADTGQTADTEAPGIILGGNSSTATVTRTLADGTTIALQREAIIVHPTYAAAGATTLTIAATLAITGAPVAGSNITITNPYSFYVAAGLAKFLGGISSNGAGVQSERVGRSATAGGSFASAFGDSAAAGGDQSVAVGFSSTVNGGCTGGIAIGPSASLGSNTNASIAIGLNAATTATTATNSIAIGTGAVTKTANTVVFGGSSQPINILHGGKGEDHATPVSFTISGTHGLGSNIAGADIVIQAGAGTGTGISGAIVFKTSPVGSSGSTRSTPAECARFTTGGVLAFPTTITSVGTTGDQTINKQSGVVNIAASGTTVTVTNSLVTANSYVFATIRTADSTAIIKNIVKSAGSFVINIVACTAEVAIEWFVLNQ